MASDSDDAGGMSGDSSVMGSDNRVLASDSDDAGDMSGDSRNVIVLFVVTVYWWCECINFVVKEWICTCTQILNTWNAASTFKLQWFPQSIFETICGNFGPLSS